MNPLNTYLEQVSKAVLARLKEPSPLPLMMVEAYCFLDEAFTPQKGMSIKDALTTALKKASVYSTDDSMITLVDPEPVPAIEEMGGPRYLFTHV